MNRPPTKHYARFMAVVSAVLTLGLLHAVPAAGAQREVWSLTITGGDFSHGAPGVGACSPNPGDFSSFKCVTGGTTTPMMMGSYQPPSLTAFNFFAAPMTTFTAASATGAVPNPTGTPNGTVDDVTGVITLDFGGWYAQWSGSNVWQGTNPNNVFSTSTAATGTCTNIANDSCNFDIRWHSYITTDPFRGSTWYWHLTGTAVLQHFNCFGNCPPVVNSITIPVAEEGIPINWTPSFSDVDFGDVHTCTITVPPTHGTAFVAADCSGGTYTAGPGTAGLTDSFVYTVTDNNSVGDPAGPLSGSAVVTVASIVPNECINRYPITSITTPGGGQSPEVNATLAVTFTGNITGLTNNSVKICPGTPVQFDAVSTVGTASCVTRDSSFLIVGAKLICTNKPTGSDTDRFRILEGP